MIELLLLLLYTVVPRALCNSIAYSRLRVTLRGSVPGTYIVLLLLLLLLWYAGAVEDSIENQHISTIAICQSHVYDGVVEETQGGRRPRPPDVQTP